MSKKNHFLSRKNSCVLFSSFFVVSWCLCHELGVEIICQADYFSETALFARKMKNGIYRENKNGWIYVGAEKAFLSPIKKEGHFPEGIRWPSDEAAREQWTVDDPL